MHSLVPFQVGDISAIAATSWHGVLLTGSATAHVKGSYTQIIASTPYDVYGMWLHITDTVVAATVTSMLVDIAIGAAASEVVIIPNIQAGNANGTYGNMVFLPVFIPAGTRLSARCQGTVVSDTVRLGVYLLGGQTPLSAGMPLNRDIVTYGANTADSGGVRITASATANAKGGWTEITASTSRRHSYLCATFGLVDTTANAARFFFDIGVGAAGSERVVVPNLYVATGTNEVVLGPWPPFVPLAQHIEAGSRIAVRCQSSTASDNNIEVIVHGD